ncbi:MAG: carbohydrate kinase family protein [Oscillospiraceae bacterium]|nr:carbohydrate kinase family protein [Oscillospiraceae bacterium]
MNILVSGLLNTETTTAVRGFPIPYYPIDYPFFGINTAVSGVAFNIAKALRTLGDAVRLTSMTGSDFPAACIRDALRELGIDTAHVRPSLGQTPGSVVLYDPEGRRQIYCDLKDIQETAYPFAPGLLDGIDLVAACNINFNRPLLRLAKQAGKRIATDVHVLSDIHDDYNREFMEQADILFLSDEHIGEQYQDFLWQLAHTYGCGIIVLGRGARGAAMYLRETDGITEMPAASVGGVVNTVGAGDALFSAFLHYYAKGCAPADALRRAQIFAACKITVSGASQGFVTEAEIERRLGSWQ